MNILYQRRTSTLCFSRWTRNKFAIFATLHKVVKIAVVTFTCTLVQQSQDLLVAQTADHSAVADAIDLDEIQVSGDLPLALPQATRSMQVVQQREIHSSPVQGIDDLLETLPGLDIRQRGSEVQSDISIRGGSFDQVLILLNGINITDPQTGHYNLDLPVDINNIYRLEVLQGSAARIWGSNAFSGVINIVTDVPKAKLGGSLKTQLSYGSFGQWKVSGNYRYDWNKWYTAVSASLKKSDGYIANTDYESVNTMFEASRSESLLGYLHFQLGYQQKDYGANSFYSFLYPNQYERTKTLFGSLDWQKRIGKELITGHLNQRLHHDRFELFRDGLNAPTWYTTHNYHLTQVTSGDLNMAHQSLFGKTFVGLEVRNEHILSNVLGDPLPAPQKDGIDHTGSFTKSKNRLNGRLFVDQTLHLFNLTLSGGVSINQNSDYGSFTTGGLDAGYRINNQWMVQANWNKSFRMPTFNDLYYHSTTQTSNPNLKPEKSNTFEINAQYSNNKFKAFASVFYRAGTDVIDWVKLPSDSTMWLSRNETSIDAFGNDLVLEYSNTKGFIRGIKLSHSFLKMNKAASGYDSKYALDYLNQKTVLRLEHQILKTPKEGLLSAVWSLNHQVRSGTYTNFSTGLLNNYAPTTLCDFRLNWKINCVSVYLDGNNLFDKTYADFGGLTQPGRSVQLGMRYSL